jgi:hypothetical protein
MAALRYSLTACGLSSLTREPGEGTSLKRGVLRAPPYGRVGYAEPLPGGEWGIRWGAGK